MKKYNNDENNKWVWIALFLAGVALMVARWGYRVLESGNGGWIIDFLRSLGIQI